MAKIVFKNDEVPESGLTNNTFEELNTVDAQDILGGNEAEPVNAAVVTPSITEKEVIVMGEVVEKREVNAKHYKMSDGTIRAFIYNNDVHYMDTKENELRDIDNTPVFRDAEGEGDFAGYQNKAGDIKIKLAKKIKSKTLLFMQKGEHEIMWRLIGHKKANANGSENVNTYVEARDIVARVIGVSDSYNEKTLPMEMESVTQVTESLPELTIQEQGPSYSEQDMLHSFDNIGEALTQDNVIEQVSDPAIKGVSQSTKKYNKETEKSGMSVENVCYENAKKLSGEIRYDNFIQGADLQYIVGVSSIKENIIVKEKLDNYDFAFELKVKSLDLRLADDEQSVEFYVNHISDDGAINSEVVFSMPPAYMIDANGKQSNEITYEIELLKNSTYILKILPDTAWINSDERAFPVIIDPTVMYRSSSAIQSRTICQAGDNYYPYGHIFNRVGWIGADEARTYVKWNLSSLNTVKVVNAVMNLYQMECSYLPEGISYNTDFQVYKVLNSWNPYSMTWSSKPSYGELLDIIHYDKSINNAGSGGVPRKPPISLDITKLFTSSTSYGIMMKAAATSHPQHQGSNYDHYIHWASESWLNEGYEEYAPHLMITYLENRQIQGEEQQKNSVGRAGTAMLDLYTKNLQFIHEDFSIAGKKLPMEISHIYNSRTASYSNIAPSRGGYSSGNIGMGLGWKTNLHQYMFPYTVWNSSHHDPDEVYGLEPKYVYIDQYGNEHVFIRMKLNQSEHEYIDENGTGMLYNPSTRIIHDQSGNKWYFDTNYRLYKIEDGNGNYIYIYYTSFGQISMVRDGGGRFAYFNYSGGTSGSTGSGGYGSGLLSSIEHMGQDVVTFSYDGINRLTKITYLDNTTSVSTDNPYSQYAYGENGNGYFELSSVRDQTGYKLSYIKSGNVTTIRESTNVSKISNDSVITCPETLGGEVSITFGTDRSTVATKDGKKTVHIFDRSGKTRCSYIDRSGYVQDNEANAIEQLRCSTISVNEMFASDVQIGAINKITDSSFEASMNVWSGAGSPSSLDKFKGNFSYRIPSLNGATCIASRNIYNLGNPKSMVLSCFAKANSLPIVQDGSRTFRIGGRFIYSDGTTETMKYADYNPYETGWQGAAVGLSKSYQNRNKTISRAYITMEYSDNYGSAYFDNISLQDSRYVHQKIENNYVIMRNGVEYPITQISKIKYVTKEVILFVPYQKWHDLPTSENGTFVLEGDDLQKMLAQDLSSGWGSIYFKGELVESAAAVGSIDWDWLNGAKADIYITVDGTEYSLYDGFVLRNSQTITIDNGSGQTVKLVTDLKGNIEQGVVADANGQTFTTNFKYDTTGKQLSEQNWRNIRTENQYNGYGNLVKQVLRNTGNGENSTERFIQDFGYSNSGNSLSKVHDGRGSENSSAYDTVTSFNNSYGRVSSITLPDGQQISSSYYTDRKLSGVSTTIEGESVANSYTYTRGLLTRLVSNGSVGGTGSYAGKNIYTFEYDGFGVLTHTLLNGRVLKETDYYSASDYYSSNENTFNHTTKKQIRTKDSGGNLTNDRIDCEKEIYGKDGSIICRKSYVTDGNGSLIGAEKEILRVTYDTYGRVLNMTDYSLAAAQVYTNYYKQDGSLDYINLSGAKSGTLREIYDIQQRLTAKNITFANESRNYTYGYDTQNGAVEPDNRLLSIQLPSDVPLTYSYDTLGRAKSRTISPTGESQNPGTGTGSYGGGGTSVSVSEIYSYLKSPANDRTTNYVQSIYYSANNFAANATYTYDTRGNIKTSSENGASYVYDSLNRLVRENNSVLGFTKVFTYDANGNILVVAKYAYTTASTPATLMETLTYGYDTSGLQRDRLISITKKNASGTVTGSASIGNYDNLGNPCSYYGNVLQWTQGRRLAACGNITFKYNVDGIRQEKVSAGTTHTYFTEGSRIYRENRTKSGVTDKLWYYYDAAGVIGLEYNNTPYYFQKNALGDVVRIVDGNGVVQATYRYDAWGNHNVYVGTGTTLANSGHIGRINPFRYRSYYFDEDLGLYYLESRYYDPTTCRFINADDVDVASDVYSQTLNGLNLYSYCLNNPIKYADPSGHWVLLTLGIILGAGLLLVSINALIMSIRAYKRNPTAANLFWLIFAAIDVAISLVALVFAVVKLVQALKPAAAAMSTSTKLVTSGSSKAVKTTASLGDDITTKMASEVSGSFTDDAYRTLQGLPHAADGSTISTMSAGRRIHKGFMAGKRGSVAGGSLKGGTGFFDGLDEITKTIFELKPNNVKNIAQGARQLRKYGAAMQNFTGIRYNLVLVLY